MSYTSKCCVMDFKELSKKEYIARINRVIDYISQNMNQTIDLSLMSDIAAFSPYHFHRIFTYIVGETPNNFLSRVRLERQLYSYRTARMKLSVKYVISVGSEIFLHSVVHSNHILE